MDNNSVPFAEGEPSSFGGGNPPMTQSMLSPAKRQNFPWDFAIAKSRGINLLAAKRRVDKPRDKFRVGFVSRDAQADEIGGENEILVPVKHGARPD